MTGENAMSKEAKKSYHFNSNMRSNACLLYTSDAADDSLRVDLGGRRIIKKGLCAL